MQTLETTIERGKTTLRFSYWRSVTGTGHLEIGREETI